RLFELSGDEAYRDAALRSFGWQARLMAESPRAVESALLALARWYDGGSAARPASPAPAPALAEPADSEAADARAQSASGAVLAEAFAETLRVPPGAAVRVAIRLTIARGWHVNTDRPEDPSLVATRVSLREGSGFRLGEVAYPAGRSEPGLAGLAVFGGRVIL